MKRFSVIVMNVDETFKLNKGLFDVAKKKAGNKFNSRSDYYRHLIMSDNNCDEYGEEKKDK